MESQGGEKTVKISKLSLLIGFLFMSIDLFPATAKAATTESNQTGSVTVTGAPTSAIVDPENPEKVANPGDGPSTEGTLRIDYVSSLSFENGETNGRKNYQAFAQQFLDDTGARGSYVQITDQREYSTGWRLQVKQAYQFRSSVLDDGKSHELSGAVLSLDKAWANSSGFSAPPVVKHDTISLNGTGAAYEVATAEKGTGQGVWTIEFGSSDENKNNQEATLMPALNKEDQPVVDKSTQKQEYLNSAIQLMVPDNIAIYPTTYGTELIWLLNATP